MKSEWGTPIMQPIPDKGDMMSEERRLAARHLAWEMVAQEAPEELDLFDELICSATDSSTTTSHDDDPLAFGLTESLHVLTPAALSIATSVIIVLAGRADTAGVDIVLDLAKKN